MSQRSSSDDLVGKGISVKQVMPRGGVSGTMVPVHAGIDAMPVPGMTPVEIVTDTVFEAPTDGMERLPNLVGEDTRGFIKAWESLLDAECDASPGGIRSGNWLD